MKTSQPDVEYTGAPLGITMGCPVGIGPELIVKLFSDHYHRSRIPAVVIGDPAIIEGVCLERGVSLQVTEWAPGEHIAEGTIPVYRCSDLSYQPERWGRPDAETGRAMGGYIEAAVNLITQGAVTGMVTCPISKLSLNLGGYPFPGHTEMLGHLTGTKHYRMMMTGSRLTVVLVTIHEPLEKVPSLLSEENIADCIAMTMESLRTDFGINEPKLAVAGLNPHGGESSMFGDQEERLILPAIKRCSSLGSIQGPLPPDTVFHQAAAGKFDAVIAMYHDQGLIPFKLLHFEDGVNVTLGLPIVRTSVDHGTAYDIAGQWKADHTSLVSATTTAELIVKNRQRANML